MTSKAASSFGSSSTTSTFLGNSDSADKTTQISDESGTHDVDSDSVSAEEQSKQDSSEQQQQRVQALLEVATILSKLAAMDTTIYQSTITRPDVDDETTVTAAHLQQRLDRMQEQWKLEDTPIPNLTRSIHRFHSNITILQAEVDQQADEIDVLTQKITDLVQEKQKLAKVTEKLHAKNKKLSAKLQERKNEKKSLIKHVKEYVQQVRDSEQHQKELEELNTVYKLQAHEQFLMLAKNRDRTESADSNFSDLDALDFAAENSKPCDNHDEDDDDDDDKLSISSTSVSSCSSLVTDEGIATVKFPAHLSPVGQTSPSPEAGFESTFDSDYGAVPPLVYPAAPPLPTYTLSFPRPAKIGLKIRPIPMEQQSLHKPRHHQPKGLLTDALLADEDTVRVSSSSELDAYVTHKAEGSNPMGFSLNLNSFLGKNTSDTKTTTATTAATTPYAFLVYDYTSNFDTELNSKPPIGARIVAVNGEAVKESWTLAELLEHLRGGDTKTTSVTFRNDLLSEKQQELLSMSSEDFQVFTDSNKRARKEKATSEPSQQEVSKQSGFHFGFLNMGGSGVPAAEIKGEMTKSNKKAPNTISSETNTTGLKEASNRGRHTESAKGERSYRHGFGFWGMGGVYGQEKGPQAAGMNEMQAPMNAKLVCDGGPLGDEKKDQEESQPCQKEGTATETGRPSLLPPFWNSSKTDKKP